MGCGSTTTQADTQYSEVLYFAYKDEKDSDDGGSEEFGEGSGSIHNQAKSCLSCHSFSSDATVFHSLKAGDNTA